MSNYVFLNNVEHSDLRVIDYYSEETGDNKAVVAVFPTEFLELQKEYPLLLKKDDNSGELQAAAILGLKADENLFLENNIDDVSHASTWRGLYVPALIARGPFIIGLKESEDGNKAPYVYIDLDSPKISKSTGRSLFLEHGGNSDYLNSISDILGNIQNGIDIAKEMYKEFDALNLIEPITINIDLINGDKIGLEKYFTISEEKLKDLSGSDLERLSRNNFLQCAYFLINSLSNFKRLIHLKNARLLAQNSQS